MEILDQLLLTEHWAKMKVMAFDPFLTKEKASELSVEKVDLDTLLKMLI